MASRLIVETTFLIDLEREARRGEQGPARQLLAANAEAHLFVTPTILGELACGATLADRMAWEELVRPFSVLPIDREVSWEYGVLYRFLQQNGLLIGANDLWIAAAAVAHGMPVVTRNLEHFRRVPRLEVVGYSRAPQRSGGKGPARSG